MNKSIRARAVVILFVTCLSIYLFAGFPPSLAHMKERIHRGLDLNGGMQLVLQVVTDDAVRAETDNTIDAVRSGLRKDNISFRQVSRKDNGRFIIDGLDPGADAKFRRALTDSFPDWEVVTFAASDGAYTIALKADKTLALRAQTIDQSINTIRNRIDQLGLVDPTIQKRGDAGSEEIFLQLPGVNDFDRVKLLLQASAVLELKLVDAGPFPDLTAAAQNYGGNIPEDIDLLQSSEHETTNKSETSYYTVHHEASLTGRDLKNAYPSRDENGHPAVTFNLTADGSIRFSQTTEANIGKRLAIILDGRIQSAPIIFARISDSGVIKGGSAGFTPQQAADLSLMLRSGALPASIRYMQEEAVGPSLGLESILKGIYSAAAALVAVAAFMLFYYRLSGLNATIAMALNLIILLGTMAYFGATLTLPGIAGIILTIGVGIDSNVLIFERIREELRTGKTAASAVSTSFDRVFLTLVDTHLAALISATFLFLFGTGPVKGFAVTLVIGLVSNMFTAVFVSRTLFDLVLSRTKADSSISI